MLLSHIYIIPLYWVAFLWVAGRLWLGLNYSAATSYESDSFIPFGVRTDDAL